MSETSQVPAMRFRIVHADGRREELDRFAIRDRIRAGEIDVHTRIATIESEDVHPAGTYPELARYFEMFKTVAKGIPQESQEVRAAPRVVDPMSRRVADVAYALRDGRFAIVTVLAVFSMLPIVGFVAALGALAMSFAIVRKTARGAVAEGLIDLHELGDFARRYVLVLIVSLITLLPLGIAFAWSATALMHAVDVRIVIGIEVVVIAFTAYFYPICLATIAVRENLLAALNPAEVAHVRRTIGADYVVVLVTWLIAGVIGAVVRLPMFSPANGVPLIVSMFGSFLSLWMLFHASQLLGYAVHRHAPELAWE